MRHYAWTQDHGYEVDDGEDSDTDFSWSLPRNRGSLLAVRTRAARLGGSMTRMHFKSLAESLARTKPDIVKGQEANSPSLLQWKRDCEAVASSCREFNPGFDRGRFLDACNYYDEKGE